MDYPAKILLFGEYGIILKSMALAIPYFRFSGQFTFADAKGESLSEEESESNKELSRVLTYFQNDIEKFGYLDFKHFKDDVNRGIYFGSTIPHGYGLGSSGALTAAIYERYSCDLHHNDYQKIKTELAAIENCFHGSSSGIDPLTSLLKQPVLLENETSAVSTTDLSPFFNTYTMFLINTNSRGNTGELVTRFLKRYRDAEYRERIDNEYIPLINQTIDAAISSNLRNFGTLITRYSEFQLSHFGEMIPATFKKYFEYGSATGEFHLKLCGSGGGGYLLAFSADRLKAEAYFNLNHLDYSIV